MASGRLPVRVAIVKLLSLTALGFALFAAVGSGISQSCRERIRRLAIIARLGYIRGKNQLKYRLVSVVNHEQFHGLELEIAVVVAIVRRRMARCDGLLP
jgi:hypothetical protein